MVLILFTNRVKVDSSDTVALSHSGVLSKVKTDFTCKKTVTTTELTELKRLMHYRMNFYGHKWLVCCKSLSTYKVLSELSKIFDYICIQ